MLIGIVFIKTQKTRTNVLKCIDNQKNILYNCFVIKESVGKRGIMAKTVEKDSALEQVLADIEKQFGKGAIMKLGEQEHKEVEVCPSGSLSLDIALGVGGYPKGRIIEIYGPESSGKTTFALHAIAEVQKQGGRAAFIDAEHSLDPVYAHNLGVNTDELLLSQPDTGEQAL